MKKSVKIVLTVFLALVIAAAAFTGGYFTRKYLIKGAVGSYEWAIGLIEDKYYYLDPDQSFAGTAIGAIVDEYLDEYSEYYTAEEYEALVNSNAGNKSGVGISYSFVSGKGVFIASVVGNSPAYKCGLCAGEYLTGGSYDGNEVVSFTSKTVFQGFIDGVAADVEFYLYSDSAQYTVAKSEYRASYAYMCTSSTSWYFTDSADGGLALTEDISGAMSFLPDGAAYLSLYQFYGTAASEFAKLVQKFNAVGCTSLILDLRSNGGGSVDVMREIAGAFAGGKAETAMIAESKSGSRTVYKTIVSSADSRISSDCEVYVLANSGTASASEALMGALVCYGVLEYENIFLSDYSEEYLSWLESGGSEAKTRRTYGKGIMQSTYVNELTGEALKLTTAQIYWPDGSTCIHGTGITADMGCTPLYAEWSRTLGDEELQLAASIIASR